MSARKGRKTSIGGQFAPRRIEMLESPAYRELSQAAHRVISRLEIELGHHGGNDNGKLPTTFDHFEEYGIHRQAIGPAIREVVALGFVEITRAGRAGNGEFRQATLYRLTYRATERQDVTDDWRSIETAAEAATVAKAARLAKPVRKSKTPVVVSASFRGGIRTTNAGSPVVVSTTTCSSTEITTTSRYRGGDQRRPIKQDERGEPKPQALVLPHNSGPIILAAVRLMEDLDKGTGTDG